METFVEKNHFAFGFPKVKRGAGGNFFLSDMFFTEKTFANKSF